MAASAGNVPQAVLEEQVRTNYLIMVSTWMNCIMVAVLAWDCLCSLYMEYNRIWRQRFTLPSVMYLLSRYWAIGAIAFNAWAMTRPYMSEGTCSRIFNLETWLLFPIEIFSGSILLMRTWAVGGRSWILLVALLTAFGAILGVMAWSITLTFHVFIPNAAGTGGVCIAQQDSRAIGYWISPLAFNTILTALQVFYFQKMRRTSGGQVSTLMAALMNSGLAYFVVTFVVSLVTVIFTAVPDPLYHGVTIAIQQGVSSMMSCRLILSLRDPALSGKSATATDSGGMFSKIRDAFSGPSSRHTRTPSIGLNPYTHSSSARDIHVRTETHEISEKDMERGNLEDRESDEVKWGDVHADEARPW